MTTGIIILAVIIVLFALVLFAMWLRGKKIDEMYPDTVQRIAVSKEDNFEAILKKYEVPEDYYKIVISQSRNYSVVNCPAVIWKTEEKVKVLVLKAQPFLAEEEIEDFTYIASSPFVNFRQFDGTEFPDWAVQTEEVKNLIDLYNKYIDNHPVESEECLKAICKQDDYYYHEFGDLPFKKFMQSMRSRFIDSYYP